MSTDLETSWQGDWRDRLQLGIRRCGFATLDQFLAAHPADTYFALARRLDANIAPMQLYGEQLRSAQRANCIRQAAADCLARFLVHHLKRGWGSGRHFNSRLAAAYAAWKSSVLHFTQDTEDLAYKIDTVWAALKKMSPPTGWRPEGADDRFIKDAFAAGWPGGGGNG